MTLKYSSSPSVTSLSAAALFFALDADDDLYFLLNGFEIGWRIPRISEMLANDNTMDWF